MLSFRCAGNIGGAIGPVLFNNIGTLTPYTALFHLIIVQVITCFRNIFQKFKLIYFIPQTLSKNLPESIIDANELAQSANKIFNF